MHGGHWLVTVVDVWAFEKAKIKFPTSLLFRYQDKKNTYKYILFERREIKFCLAKNCQEGVGHDTPHYRIHRRRRNWEQNFL